MRFKLEIEPEGSRLIITPETPEEKKILGVLVETPRDFQRDHNTGTAIIKAEFSGHHSNRELSRLLVQNFRLGDDA